MTVAELPETPPAGVVMQCLECRERYSARRSDYFAADPRTEFTCCGVPAMLVRWRTTAEMITPREAEAHP